MSSPRISTRYGESSHFGSVSNRRRSDLRMPQFFKRSVPWAGALDYTHLSHTCQAIQVSADGFRDGRLGDDTPFDRSKESIQVDLPPQTSVALLQEDVHPREQCRTDAYQRREIHTIAVIRPSPTSSPSSWS